MAEVDDLRRLVQQLQAENADLQNQVATLRQASHHQIQMPLQRGENGSSHQPQPLAAKLPTATDPFQAQFEAFVAHAPSLFWITDAQGKMTYANSAWLAVVNLSEQEAIGQSIETLFPDALAQAYLQNNRWVLDHQAVLETIEQAPLPDGTTHTYLVRKFPVRSSGVAIASVGGIAIDITELKQTEAALRDSEARWQFAIEGAGDGLWDWNAQTNEVFFSHQWKAMLGYEDHEIGTSLDEWDSRVHPGDKTECYADLQRHFSGETAIYQNEHRMRCKDGSYKWILDRGKVVQWDEHGKPLRVIGTHKDISDRKQTEIRQQQMQIILRQSEVTNRAILNAIPDLLLRVGRDGTCLSFLPPVDAAAGTFLPVYNHLSEVLPPDLLHHQLQRIECAMETGELQVWEHQIEKHGQLCHEEVRLAPCGDQECLVIVRDVSDRKHREAEHMQAVLELQNTKDQLDLVLQASSEGYWDWNLETGDIYFSSQWKAMLGYADHELENSLAMWESVIFAEDRDAALRLIDDYNSGRVREFSITQRLHHKNGSTVHVLCRAIHQKNVVGKVIRMVGSHLNITAMVTVQAALETSKMQLASVLNSSLDGIMAFRSVRDKTGAIVDFEWLLSNPSACTTVGRTADYLIGKRLLDEMPGNKTDGLFDLYMQVVETGEAVQRQFHYSHDGIDTWFENIAVKLGDGFAVTFSNITPLKQSEQALQQVNEQLESRLNELKQRNEDMRLLGKMSDFLQTCLSVEAAHQALAALVAPLFPGSSGGIFIFSDARYRVERVAVWGTAPSSTAEFIPLDCCALGERNLHQVDLGCLGLQCSHAESSQAIATLCLPLLAQNEPLGLFYLSAPHISESVRYLAHTVAEQLSLALANLHLRETLKQQSIRDPLTRLFNRRYLEESLAQAIQEAQRHHHPIGVIMLDIDHFKWFNDTYGHAAGDRVLQAVGQLLLDSVRGSDIACRYGGEEMLLVLPRSSLEVTVVRAEEIRQAISQLQMSYEGLALGALTTSLGVASYPVHGLTEGEVIRAADAALYQAKAQGRNRVVAATVPAAKVAPSSGAS
ncbi:diguanylate cyclase [Nodosilinea sp. LEGE 06152]|uniref:diguanylate cyclase n=1 Tax=Nodosilinea sp. LEGE 06152 TaxID=2777966 RepID=UPI001880E33B|nr:diguanylate cyclase [Nodosilinea sp. LEGE 06152]MBE9158536.1 diguanylate cyclase [Nodosilinea sp. LEGE 06152]